MSNPPSSPVRVDLPAGVGSAMMRGVTGRCPRCGLAPLFRAWLKPVDTCSHCRLDWSVQQADDFPAYIGIFVVGHLLAPVVIVMIAAIGMSAWLTLAIILPVAVIMLIGMLQPTKAGVIAFLWWYGIGAFVRERRPTDDTEA